MEQGRAGQGRAGQGRAAPRMNHSEQHQNTIPTLDLLTNPGIRFELTPRLDDSCLIDSLTSTQRSFIHIRVLIAINTTMHAESPYEYEGPGGGGGGSRAAYGAVYL